jgi:predicted choloylglycine hydrolase
MRPPPESAIEQFTRPVGAAVAPTILHFEAISEDQPGPKWQSLFGRFWPAYKRWFLSKGDKARPRYLTSIRELRKYMPELIPTYEHLVELAGDGDLFARFLSAYCPPSYLIACSQAVWHRDTPLLVRNYDYNPQLYEGIILKTAWNGRQVIAMSDCLWGVLDGFNEDGLSLSLSFGGRRTVGAGFSVPLLLRYILEFATTTKEAVTMLERVPVHMAYNVTVLDRSGQFVTAYLRPDQPPVIRAVPYAANHQDEIEWKQHAQATQTLQREQFLFEQVNSHSANADDLIQSFLRPPLYSTAFARGYGTIYTAVYKPEHGEVDFLWPGNCWRQSFNAFEEGTRTVAL